MRQIYLATLPPSQLPLEKEIVKIHAGIFDWSNGTVTEFDVPQRFWNRVVKTLSQASRDDFPMKWQVYGQLKITSRDGSMLSIAVYHIIDSQYDTAVFAVERSQTDRTFYRGGSQAALLTALSEAKADAGDRDE